MGRVDAGGSVAGAAGATAATFWTVAGATAAGVSAVVAVLTDVAAVTGGVAATGVLPCPPMATKRITPRATAPAAPAPTIRPIGFARLGDSMDSHSLARGLAEAGTLEVTGCGGGAGRTLEEGRGGGAGRTELAAGVAMTATGAAVEGAAIALKSVARAAGAVPNAAPCVEISATRARDSCSRDATSSPISQDGRISPASRSSSSIESVPARQTGSCGPFAALAGCVIACMTLGGVSARLSRGEHGGNASRCSVRATPALRFDTRGDRALEIDASQY
jgi:hypothetical protein